MLINLFNYEKDYRDYIRDQLKKGSEEVRGSRNALALAIGVQGAFVSQVLGLHAHFNLEHGEKINHFFGHTEEESHYFLLLIQRTRAGTKTLEKYFDQQLAQIREARLVLKNRFKVGDVLSRDNHITYYSAWYYGAIRVLLTIPEFQTKEHIAKRLPLPLAKVTEVLEFLVSRGLARQEEDRYFPTEKRMHLGNDSALISKHHTNWRMKSIVSLEHERKQDLHYSSVVSMSHADRDRVREILVECLERIRGIVRDSPEEEIFSLNCDLFEV